MFAWLRRSFKPATPLPVLGMGAALPVPPSWRIPSDPPETELVDNVSGFERRPGFPDHGLIYDHVPRAVMLPDRQRAKPPRRASAGDPERAQIRV
jgi:hypothetical protein